MNRKKKDERIEMLCTTEQLEILQERASKQGLKLGPFLLMCGLNSRIEIKLGADPTATHVEKAVDMYREHLITQEEFAELKKRIFDDLAHTAFRSLERRIRKDKEQKL